MPDFWLSPYTSACDCGTHVLLLDVRTNQYLSIDARAAAAIAEVTGHWPVVPQDLSEVRQRSVASALLEPLLRRGYLQRMPTPERTSALLGPELPAAIRSLRYDSRTQRAALDLRHTFRVARRLAFAAMKHRLQSLEKIIVAVRDRRDSAPPRTLNDATALYALSRFERVRPYFLASRDRCFTHSLALLDYLADDDIHPHWVLGVRARPFAAHCWLQQGECVWGDHVDVVVAYKPILVI